MNNDNRMPKILTLSDETCRRLAALMRPEIDLSVADVIGSLLDMQERWVRHRPSMVTVTPISSCSTGDLVRALNESSGPTHVTTWHALHSGEIATSGPVAAGNEAAMTDPAASVAAPAAHTAGHDLAARPPHDRNLQGDLLRDQGAPAASEIVGMMERVFGLAGYSGYAAAKSHPDEPIPVPPTSGADMFVGTVPTAIRYGTTALVVRNWNDAIASVIQASDAAIGLRQDGNTVFFPGAGLLRPDQCAFSTVIDTTAVSPDGHVIFMPRGSGMHIKGISAYASARLIMAMVQIVAPGMDLVIDLKWTRSAIGSQTAIMHPGACGRLRLPGLPPGLA